MVSNKATWRRFSIRVLLISIAIFACLLAAYQYREQAIKPDLSITAADVAWATDYHIWKIDLSEQRDVYGVQVVAFEDAGKTKRWLCRIGGESPIDTSKHPVLTVSLTCDDGSVSGKLNFTGGTSFIAENLFNGKSTAWAGTPVVNKDYYYLVSDSQTISGGKQPFEKSSNKLAIEILRNPYWHANDSTGNQTKTKKQTATTNGKRMSSSHQRAEDKGTRAEVIAIRKVVILVCMTLSLKSHVGKVAVKAA